MPEIPAEAVQAAADAHERWYLDHGGDPDEVYRASHEQWATATVEAAAPFLAAHIARESFTPVQGTVKECPQSAPGSTESAQTPTSRVSVPPETSEGITEPRGADVRAVIAPETRGAFGADPSQEHQPQSPPQSRWDGETYWGAGAPAVIERHLALLRPMLANYPAIPDGYDGWWRF